MPFFDFHCHPGLKPTFANQVAAPSPWDFISARLDFLDMKIGINRVFNEVLNSQCNLTQLYGGKVKLFGIALHSPEANMARGLLDKGPVERDRIEYINHNRLMLIEDGNHYFEFLNDDLQRLQTPAPPQLQGAKLKVIQTAADFNEADAQTIHAFLIIEGLHCFFDNQTAPDAKQVFRNNFEDFTDNNTILAMNVCHLQQNQFCNHAFGIQFINPTYFYPAGNGITNWGKEMIDRMIQKNILVDIKHMSLWSRWQLYSHLQDAALPNKFIAPIICTHAGLTGLSIRDRVKYLYQRPVDKGNVYEVQYLKPKSPYLRDITGISQRVQSIYFNCSSINLYDEDIENILLSDGLIGLSFDQRILGFADESVERSVVMPHDVEYISKQEANFFLGPNPSGLPLQTNPNAIWTLEDFEDLEPVLDTIVHPLFFLNQVLHILTVAKRHPAIGVQKALTKICLGTDYDGLINALDNCKDVERLEVFKQLTISEMPGLLRRANLANEGIDVTKFMNDIFYNNGKNFIMNRLQAIGR